MADSGDKEKKNFSVLEDSGHRKESGFARDTGAPKAKVLEGEQLCRVTPGENIGVI